MNISSENSGEWSALVPLLLCVALPSLNSSKDSRLSVLSLNSSPCWQTSSPSAVALNFDQFEV